MGRKRLHSHGEKAQKTEAYLWVQNDRKIGMKTKCQKPSQMEKHSGGRKNPRTRRGGQVHKMSSASEAPALEND